MSALLKLDVLGEIPKLYYNKEERYRTAIGTVTSILSLFVCILITIYYYFDIFDVKNLNVILNRNTIINPYANLSNYPILISVMDNYGYPIKNFDNLARLQASFWERDALKVNWKNITLEKCNREFHLGEYARNLTEDFDLSNYYCLPPNNFNFSLYGVYGDKLNKFSNLEIYVAKCFNDGFLPKIKCSENSVIDQKLKRILINIIYVDSEIDHQNLENPIKYKLKSIYTPTSATVFRKYITRKKIITYISDFGLFQENLQKNSFFQQDFSETLTDLRVDDSSMPIFFQYSISFSDTNELYNRKFIRFHSLFGNLWFIYRLVFFVAGAFSNYFSRKKLYFGIYNIIFAKFYNQNENRQKFYFKYSLDDFRNRRTDMNNSKINSKKSTLGPKFNERIKFKNYLVPLFFFKKIKEVKFLDKFIQIYHRKLSIENLLETILKMDNLGKNLEDMKIIEFNNLHNIDRIYNENMLSSHEKISKFSLNPNNSRNELMDINRASNDFFRKEYHNNSKK